MSKFELTCIIIGTVCVIGFDFIRDLVTELQIRKGMEAKEARKGFKFRKFLAGEYKDLFTKQPEVEIKPEELQEDKETWEN